MHVFNRERLKVFFKFLSIIFIFFVSSPSIAHQFQKENININHPHIKFTISSGPAAGYMTIVNMGDKADKLLNIKVDFAVAELHLSEINDGIVSMNKVDFIEIPAQIAKSLKPGGYHVMFSKFNIELIDESELIGVLNFELAGEIKVVFEVETQKNKDDYTEH
jgi:copper(I)-binding protein